MLHRIAIGTLALFIVTVVTARAAPPTQPVRYDNHKVVEVFLETPDDIDMMLAISQRFWACQLGLGPQLWTVALNWIKIRLIMTSAPLPAFFISSTFPASNFTAVTLSLLILFLPLLAKSMSISPKTTSDTSLSMARIEAQGPP